MAHIVHPFEMEEGRAEVLKAEQHSDRQNHCSKFACCWVFLSLVLVLGVLTAVFYPKKPHVSLFSTSLLEIDGFTGECAEKEGDVGLWTCFYLFWFGNPFFPRP